MKKAIALALAVVMVFALCACGTAAAPAAAPAADAAPATEAAPAAETTAEPVVISISNSYTDLDQVNVELAIAAENIAKRTDGAVTVNIFPNNTFGNMADGIEAISSNAPLMLMAAFSQFDDMYPDGSALQAGFVFESGEEFLRFMDTDLFARVVEEMDAVNVHALPCSFIGGMRQVIGKAAYTTPAEIKGLKLRVPASTPYLQCFEALGASPMGMPASEQLQALSSGTVDALDQSISLIYSTKSYELVKEVTLLNQMPLADSLFCSTTWWNSLPEEYRTVIEEELNACGLRYYDYSMENESVMRAEMEAAGVVFHDVDRAPFAELALPLMDQYTIGQDVMDTVAQIRADIAAGK